MPVPFIPSGYHALTPYLIIDGASKAIDWYVQILGASELMRLPAPGGRVGHAEVEIGGCRIMLADENAEYGAKAPAAFGGSPVSLVLYLPDVDATLAQAAQAGATIKAPAEDKFYGDRMATLLDPFGHTWSIATHIEDVSPAEMERRLAAMGAAS